MRKTLVKARFIVPILAFALAFACAPAAFATDLMPAEEGDEAVPSEQSEDPEAPDLSKATITLSGTSFVYTGGAIEPKVTVTADGKTLTEGTDYWKFYDNNINVGTAEAWAYNDQKELSDGSLDATFAEFTIKPASIKNTKIKVTNEVFTGKAVKPAVLVKFKGATLKKGKDYTVKYSKRKKIGTSKVIIYGKGNFTGKITKKFKITKANINNLKFPNIKDRTYTGNSISPSFTLKYKGKKLKKNKDYTVSYKSNKNVGVAFIKVKGKGNFRGAHTLEFAINPASITKCDVSVPNQYWTGDPVRPSAKITYKGRTLKENRDYTVGYSGNIRVGTAKMYIRGIGNFGQLRTVQFDIQKRPIKDVTMTPVSISRTEQSYVVHVEYNGRTMGYNRDYTFSTKANYDKSNVLTSITVTLTALADGNLSGTTKREIAVK